MTSLIMTSNIEGEGIRRERRKQGMKSFPSKNMCNQPKYVHPIIDEPNNRVCSGWKSQTQTKHGHKKRGLYKGRRHSLDEIFASFEHIWHFGCLFDFLQVRLDSGSLDSWCGHCVPPNGNVIKVKTQIGAFNESAERILADQGLSNPVPDIS